MYRVYFHQATMRKPNKKIGKAQNSPSVRKSYSTNRKGTGDHKKKGNKIKAVKTGVQ